MHINKDFIISKLQVPNLCFLLNLKLSAPAKRNSLRFLQK